MDTSMAVHLASKAQIAAPHKRTRQRHSVEFKQGLVEQALQPGVSVAGLALEHGLNANLLRAWITKYELAQRQCAAITDTQTSVSPFARVPVAHRVDAAPASAQVSLPNGVQINLARVDADMLTAWLIALNALPCSSSIRR